MRHALTLAGRALGCVAPNPAVGCVIISREGRVLGRGWTQPGGRPHAETVALAQAGEAARGGAAYVTLEPCAHQGRTPPCAQALIAAGVSRVIAAVEDPDPRVKGKGFAALLRAGIEVTTGVLEQEAAELNKGFFLRIERDRPLVTLKIAQSGDGKTIPAPGTNRWITGEDARRFAHLLRARNDAVLVGIGTVLADDPMLDCRLPGLEERSPVRVVLDSRLRLAEDSKIARTAMQLPTIVFTASEGGDRLRARNVEVLHAIKDVHGRPELKAILGVLAQRGLTRLLVEGGATVISRFLEEGFADRLEIFTSAAVLGDAAGGEVAGIADPAGFKRVATRMLGPDLLESYASTA